MRILVTVIMLIFYAHSASAEYRAFELSIVDQVKGTERRTLSTLDHLQYAEYYPVGANEVVQYVTSWRCWGRTSHFKRICPNPKSDSAAAPKPNSAAPRAPSSSP